jgi:hypothetical protein
MTDDLKLREISVYAISIADVEKYITIAFDGDNDLIDKFHFSDKTLLDTVVNNVKNINEFNERQPAFCYAIRRGSKAIGFTVLSQNILYSFGINKEYRKKDIVLEWLQWVKDTLNDAFVLCLLPENTRAIDFFVRNGMSIYSKDDQNVTLIYKQ